MAPKYSIEQIPSTLRGDSWAETRQKLEERRDALYEKIRELKEPGRQQTRKIKLSVRALEAQVTRVVSWMGMCSDMMVAARERMMLSPDDNERLRRALHGQQGLPLEVATGGMKVYHVQLTLEQAQKVDTWCQKRGLITREAFRMALLSMMKEPTIYEPNTPVQFGKYRGEQLGPIIRLDPSYVVWLDENVDHFILGPDARQLLDEVCGADEIGDFG